MQIEISRWGPQGREGEQEGWWEGSREQERERERERARHPNSEAKRRMCAVHSAEYRLTPPIIQLASNHHHVSIRSNLDSSGSGSASGGCSNDGLEWERERKRWPMHVHDKK